MKKLTWTALPMVLFAACGSVEVATDAGPNDAAHVIDAASVDASRVTVDATALPDAMAVIDAQTVFTPQVSFVQASPFTVYDQSGEISFTLNYSGGIPHDTVTWSASLSSQIGSLPVTDSNFVLDANGNATITLAYDTQTGSGNGQFFSLTFVTDEVSNDYVSQAMIELETACPLATSFTLMGQILCPSPV